MKRSTGGRTLLDKRQAQIVREHYRMNRMPTFHEVQAEIVNLRRKGMLYLDDRQVALASALDIFKHETVAALKAQLRTGE